MKNIIIDLEMNDIDKQYKQERKLCKREIIEIGAVALDENNQEIDSFMTFVKPQFNDVIVKRIEKLTGITTKMVEDAPVLELAIQSFFDWCYSLDDDFQIQQWSESDQKQISDEICFKQIVLDDRGKYALHGWKDFQKEFGLKLGLSDPISLKNAIMYTGIDIVGYYHDALHDARNTAKLFEIIHDPSSCRRALDLVIKALTPTPLYSTMGDLFNFSNLALT